MAKIEKVIGREIVDSRGNPTVEVDVVLAGAALCRNELKIFRKYLANFARNVIMRL